MSRGYGPDGLARAIVLTFDNLGEASALQRGTWNPQTPLGEDPSVTSALPRLLDALDDSRLTATFFVEGINSELNPQALREIVGRGHELGAHGWQHEDWSELSPVPRHEREPAGAHHAGAGRLRAPRLGLPASGRARSPPTRWGCCTSSATTGARRQRWTRAVRRRSSRTA